VAKWLGAGSLIGRLSWLVAIIVAAVVTAVAFLEVRAFESHIESELTDVALHTSEGMADTLGGRQFADDAGIRDILHEALEADPVIDAISFCEAGPDGPRVLASTSTEQGADVLLLAGRSIGEKSKVSARTPRTVSWAAPVRNRPNQAVVVTVGLESVIQARSHGVAIALGFALPTLLLVTVLTHFGIRSVVQQPLLAILDTMEGAADGDLSARVPLVRHDELGMIGAGLNEMLGRLGHFNETLHERIREATVELGLRNAQLAESHAQLASLQETLGRTERIAALGQMAANVAHQAGTPLNLVSGYVQMLRDDPETGPKARARLQTIDAQLHQVIRVLRAMLDHARQSSGPELTSLSSMLERVREIAAPGLARSGVRLRVAMDGDLLPIRADVTQLEVAFLNLITNARDAMVDGGELSIAAFCTPMGVRVEVADTGPGIPTKVLDRLFEPWVTTKPLGQGTGLGLAIVRDVVRAHGGTVSAYNRSLGAVFVIELPAAAADGALRS
jgi:signal transduction histidine kinase